MTPDNNTLSHLLNSAAATRAAATFLHFKDQQIGFDAFAGEVDRLAAGMRHIGLRRGDRLGIMALNQPEWLTVFFAAARLGVVIVGMSLRYRAAELTHIVRDSRVKAIAVLADHDGVDYLAMLDGMAAGLPDLEQLILLPQSAPVSNAGPGKLRRHGYAGLLEHGRQAPDPEVGPNAIAMVIYTSGTTGLPKGVGLTHASMLASARGQSKHTRVTQDDLIATALPLNHVGGITCSVLNMLSVGGSVDLQPEFNPVVMGERIGRLRPTVLGGVPTMLGLLLSRVAPEAADFSSILKVFVGGSNVEAQLMEKIMVRMPNATLMNLYGLSETSGAIVMTPWGASLEDLLSKIGTPFPDAQVRVLHPATGEPMAAGEIGELAFSGGGVVPAYVGEYAETSKPTSISGGWLQTGDLGSLDARGNITLKGRAKDMYIQGGFNVYPAEVEAFIARIAGVAMVAGIGIPDPVLGEVGRYYLVPNPGAELDPKAIIDHCRKELADYKVPRQIVIRNELPLTPAGKIRKAELREEAE